MLSKKFEQKISVNDLSRSAWYYEVSRNKLIIKRNFNGSTAMVYCQVLTTKACTASEIFASFIRAILLSFLKYKRKGYVNIGRKPHDFTYGKNLNSSTVPPISENLLFSCCSSTSSGILLK